MQSLTTDPQASAVDLAELVGIAHAIEVAAIERYRWLAEEMARRGEAETAEAFRKLEAEERRHSATVDAWAAALGQAVPESSFDWRLPPEVAQSWEEAAASALLTPYRALAIAVDNEQRAFAFYAYLAARAEDPAVAREAEALARQELEHAAVLRTWRRAAWRRDRDRSGGQALARIESGADLAAAIAAQKSEIERQHRDLAERLRAVGDEPSAAVLAEAAAASEPSPDAREPRSRAGREESRRLLIEAQQPLERLCELLETVLVAPPDESAQAQAQDALGETIARLARIGRRLDSFGAT